MNKQEQDILNEINKHPNTFWHTRKEIDRDEKCKTLSEVELYNPPVFFLYKKGMIIMKKSKDCIIFRASTPVEIAKHRMEKK